MMLLNIAFKVLLAEGNYQSVSTMSVSKSSELQSLLQRHLKDVKNNHNILLELTFYFTSISFKETLS